MVGEYTLSLVVERSPLKERSWVRIPARAFNRSDISVLQLYSCGSASSFGWDVKPTTSLCRTPNMDYQDPDITEEENL